MGKVLIAVAAGKYVEANFINEIHKIASGRHIPFVMAQGLYVHQNRNIAVKKALELEGWDRMLILDTDMTLPDNLMERAEAWKSPIVGGNYFRRGNPNVSPIAGMFVNPDEGPLYKAFEPKRMLKMLDAPGFYKADVLGTGCLGIRRDVLENWPQDKMPWFQALLTADGTEILTEDVEFCWACKQQGLQLLLDTTVQCGHAGSFISGEETYRNAVPKS